MNYINIVRIRVEGKIMRRKSLASTSDLLLLTCLVITTAVLGLSLLQLSLPLASASGSVPFFQLGPNPTNASLQENVTNIVPSNIGNVTFKTYENPGFGLTIQYPSSWAGMQLRADPFAQTNTSIVAILEAPRENQSDPYRENLIINVQGPLEDTISLEEYTQNSLNAFSTMSDTVTVIELSPSTLSGLPAHELIYSSTLGNLNLKKMQIFAIVNDNTSYIVTFGAEESQFDRYLPLIMKMVNSIRINQQAL